MPKHEFGLMEKTPELYARYDKYEPEKYHCIEIEDDDIEPLILEFQKIPCFYHTRQKTGMGLTYCGVTLIPPESAEAFLSALHRRGDERYGPLIQLFERARNEKKYVIHFGI